MKSNFSQLAAAQSYVGSHGWTLAGSGFIDDDVVYFYRRQQSLGVLIPTAKGWRFCK